MSSNEQILDEMHFLDENGKKISGENSRWMQWISVKDKLPEEGIEVLTYDPEEGITVDILIRLDDNEKNGSFRWCSKVSFEERLHEADEVTHWMPLPEPPKK